MRLAKYLAQAGVASRRSAEALVREGRVSVDGESVTDPARDIQDHTLVTVDKTPVKPATRRVVYALNKPAGVVSTAHDPRGRTTVVDLVPAQARLYPVGRLDIDATGLILLTNDGELAYRLTHPRFEVPKTYRAQVGNGPVSTQALQKLRSGVELDDGRTAPARAKRLGAAGLELTIHEGRNRQVKRMCAAVGHPVKRLERVAIADFQLGALKPGSYRRLNKNEVDALAKAAAPADRSRPRSSRSARSRPSRA
jgi:23S rRNA pseudouridine2605 synthase